MTNNALRDHVLGSCGIGDSVIGSVPLTGGSIHEVLHLTFEHHPPVVCKLAASEATVAALDAERRSLEWLQTHAGHVVTVPRTLGFDRQGNEAALVLEYFEPGIPSAKDWSNLGRQLAAIHEIAVGNRYGFDHSNRLGTSDQINTWHDDWVAFNRQCRLGPQLETAILGGKVHADERQALEMVLNRIDLFLPPAPSPSPLHGDLWSGNLLFTRDRGFAFIDPACSIGDGLADVAMMQLFGGIPNECMDAYATARAIDLQDHLPELRVYQLYHLLNHVNMFGREYVRPMMSLVDTLGVSHSSGRTRS